MDVTSCAGLRHPGVIEDSAGGGRKIYEVEKDRETMTMKIRLIFQVASQKQIKHLVLGALGCGVQNSSRGSREDFQEGEFR